MRKTCLNMVYKLAKEDSRIVFIGSDLGAGTLEEFKRDIPDRFFMEGISEQAILGMSAGLAMEGFIPYVNTIASFITRRAFEQIVIDICLHNLPVRLIGNGGGLVYGPLGPTHQTLEDIAILRSLPNMTILAPADAHEMEKIMPLTVDWPGPIYIRLAKGYDPIVTDKIENYRIGDPVILKEGKDIVFITTGRTLQIALEAAEDLKDHKISVSVLHCYTLKPVNEEIILKFLTSHNAIVTIEEHTVIGGLGSIISEIIAEHSICKPFKRIGFPDKFAEGYARQMEMMEKYGISKQKLIIAVQNLLEKGDKA